MYKKLKVAIVIPAYNEERLLPKTIETLPDFVDYVFVVNDGSTDNTWKILQDLAKKHKFVKPVNNEINHGVGYSVVNGFKHALKSDTDLIGVMASDAQCNPDYIATMIDTLIDNKLDYAKANRFANLDALTAMPSYRRIGNVIVTVLTKFATGYYSIFDSQNGYGVFRRDILERMPLSWIGKRYDYENTLLINLSILSARVKDISVPAIYGDETSSIKFLPTALRALKVLFFGFWRRIYYKYIIFNFHPIALFLFGGLFANLFGLLLGIYITYRRIFEHLSPSTGTVMLVVLPLFLGFQLLLTALIMDVGNEDKS